jgi:hypothetical protein
MSYCSVNGIRIYYEVSGEGFPLILIHANLRDAYHVPPLDPTHAIDGHMPSWYKPVP